MPTLQNARWSEGEQIGRFQVRGFLGSGAVGAVYRVFDPELGREVALKTVLYATADEVYHLKQEFRSVANIVHRNLVRLFDLVVEGDRCFFTMELVDGVPIDQHVRGAAVQIRSSGVTSSSERSRREATGVLDERRFNESIPQLVNGLAELHAFGRAHRDLKPSNVLVDAHGRVVILDFGFAVAWREAERLAVDDGAVAGTVPYMAPEQLFGGRVSPAVDWYGLGAVMYELLLGEAVFFGDMQEIVHAKTLPLDRGAVARLGEKYGPLVARLLDPDARRRPGSAEILGHLGQAAVLPSREQKTLPRLFGRRAELLQLDAALSAVLAQQTAGVVTVEGRSGIGKSALLRHFLTAHASLRIAAGRTRPQEVVPYNAFDGAMDELSQVVMRLPAVERDGIWPDNTAALLRLFPVFRRALAAPEPRPELLTDPAEERRAAFVALRELLSRLTAQRPLILCLDDVQWGDRDSSVLLGSLLTPALAARVLFVLAYRSEELATSAFLQELPQNAPAGIRTHVRLAPLSGTDSEALARELLAASGHADETAVSRLAREAEGSPFFVEELARNIAEGGSSASTRDVIGARLERLSATDRILLETVAAAGKALRYGDAIRASGSVEATRVELTRLCDLRWLRQTASGEDAAVETYHDRLRERVMQVLADDLQRLRATHGRIASTFDTVEADPEFLAFHYETAGELPAAARCTIAAAERANEALAFQHAADLFLRAVELGSETHSRPALLERRGEALTNAGRALQAAACFEQASAELEAPAHATLRLDLRRRAGEHYLRTSHYDEGLAIMDEVLRAVGSSLPRSHRRALWPSLVRRLRFLMRGNRFTPRERHEVPDAEWRRLEVLWSAGISLALLDYQRADPIALEHLLGALEHGECGQALRALAYEAGVQGGIGGSFLRSRSEDIQALVHDLAEARQVPYERAWARLGVGSCAWFAGQWRRCVDSCDESAAIFREHCRGVPWELATTDLFGLSALGIIGDLPELERRLPHALRAAEERGDLFALNNCRLGQPSILWLAQDRVSELRALATAADQSMWKGGYHSHRYHYALAMSQADLFEGDPWTALARLDEHWPGMKSSRIYYLEWPHIELRHLRARAWLLAAKLVRDGSAAPPALRKLRPDRLLRSVHREALAIAKHRIPPAAALASTLHYSIATITGSSTAAALREGARAACTAAEMTLMADLLAHTDPARDSLRRALGIH